MTKSYILTADDVVDSLTSSDQSIPLSANQGRVLNESKQDIMQVSAMQTASETHYGKIVQFVGTSTSDYINGYFYQCILDSTVSPPAYKWVAKSVQAGGGGGGGTWGSITGTLSDQTDLQTALDAKVDKVAGKGLSTEDYTSAEKTKLAGIADGAEVNVQSDWNQTDDTADDFIKNKPASMTPSTHASTHGNTGADRITLDATQTTSGIFDIARIPEGAKERLVTVADDTARFALTTDDVQKGDSVYVTATSRLYIVIDDTQLSTEAGYMQYRAYVSWDSIDNKPTSYTPSAHASTHSSDGADAITIAESQVTNLVADLASKSTVSVSQTGTASDSIQYITVDGVEKKILAESIPVYESEPSPSAVAEGEVFATPDGDDVSVQQVIFDVTYPIGFVFIQHSSTDNPTTLWQSLGIQATWTDCTSEFANRYEMASTGNNAGTQIEAGLPLPTIASNGSHTHNLTLGWTEPSTMGGNWRSVAKSDPIDNIDLPSSGAHTHSITEDTIYKSTNTTVMPLTTTVKYWRRTA